ncbi:Metal-dependent amidase/aminoacylase/carboxypeptidase [Pseudomonas syringae pv. actinidiae]|uniref:Metal-dependent amidase/aminoacylase/carboxypeptidase n=1 Tax=Pseudomonas syringae pv. actinidiae TaxID=103796 RepID=A0A2V0Q8A2_PSESF|nr:Metal-dependent amidase/aminoacylase/carboxypeptidase [Pseudomonas syringae pv. actinidiae]
MEWVAGSSWNQWPDVHGMGGRMTVESAPTPCESRTVPLRLSSPALQRSTDGRGFTPPETTINALKIKSLSFIASVFFVPFRAVLAR